MPKVKGGSAWSPADIVRTKTAEASDGSGNVAAEEPSAQRAQDAHGEGQSSNKEIAERRTGGLTEQAGEERWRPGSSLGALDTDTGTGTRRLRRWGGAWVRR